MESLGGDKAIHQRDHTWGCVSRLGGEVGGRCLEDEEGKAGICVWAVSLKDYQWTRDPGGLI